MTLGNDVRVAYTFQTMRCVMTTMAQADLPEDRNTLRTVAKNNRIQIDKPEVAGQVGVRRRLRRRQRGRRGRRRRRARLTAPPARRGGHARWTPARAPSTAC